MITKNLPLCDFTLIKIYQMILCSQYFYYLRFPLRLAQLSIKQQTINHKSPAFITSVL